MTNFNPGTYKVDVAGHNGNIEIEVTFAENKIEDIAIGENKETEGIATPALKEIPEQIIADQTLNVDTISGATVSSKAVINGLADAIKQAGGDSEVYLNKEKDQSTQEKSEDFVTDVVIIGGGGAGLSAAVSALENGAQVIVLEKGASVGGNTMRASGVVDVANHPDQAGYPMLSYDENKINEIYNMSVDEFPEEYQETFKTLQKQIENYQNGPKDEFFDSRELFIIQTFIAGDRQTLNGERIYNGFDMVSTFVDNVGDSVKWAMDKGVPVVTTVPKGIGFNWVRSTMPPTGSGFSYIEVFRDFIEENGGKILVNAKATALESVDGVVSRVTVNDDYTITAKSGVILASGGYAANAELVRKYNENYDYIPEDVKTTNSPLIEGDGLELGTSVGADTFGLGFAQMLPTADPKTGAMFTGIKPAVPDMVAVNKEGKRFVAETDARDLFTKAVLEQTDGMFYVIADAVTRHKDMGTDDDKLAREIESGDIITADTLEELAEKIDIDSAQLVETIERYNQFVENEHDEDFGKWVMENPLKEGPFYATPCKPALMHTNGGIRNNPKGEVVDVDGVVIPGLYAAGEVAGGLQGGNYVGGNAVGDAITYGRIAGKNAALRQ